MIPIPPKPLNDNATPSQAFKRPPIIDLAVMERRCPFIPKNMCETDCMAWRGQDDGWGYCARLSGEWGNDVGLWEGA